MARRITQAADAIPLPERRRIERPGPASAPAGPVLVRGRGLARRRPRSPLPSLLGRLVRILLLLAL